MATERIWLHIGAEKTGTTSIQSCLKLNRDKLLQQGVLFPKTPGNSNHTALAAYGIDDEQGIEEMRLINGVHSMNDLQAFRKKLRRDLAAEIEESGAHTVILSNEHCSSRLLTPREIKRLHDLLSPFGADIRIVFYIRSPDAFYESWYSTAIASGNTYVFPDLKPGLLRAADWLRKVQHWSSVFGSAEVFVRRIEPGRLASNDLLTDFFQTLRMESFDFNRGQRQNESLSLKPILYLRELNKRLPRFVDNQLSEERGDIVDILRRWPQKERFRLDAPITSAIWSYYEDSYERLRRISFPLDDGPLFARNDEDEDDPKQDQILTQEQIYDLTAFIWRNRR